MMSEYDHSDDAASAWTVKNDMERAGLTIAYRLATEALLQKQFIKVEVREGQDGGYTAFALTKIGMDWLQRNQDKRRLTGNERKESAGPLAAPITDDDIPFER